MQPILDGKELKLKSPGAQMANKGVSSYEHHMDSPRAAHHGSKNSNPPNAAKGENAGLGSTGMHPSADNFHKDGLMHGPNRSSVS